MAQQDQHKKIIEVADEAIREFPWGNYGLHDPEQTLHEAETTGDTSVTEWVPALAEVIAAQVADALRPKEGI
jgi:hypothetical protein